MDAGRELREEGGKIIGRKKDQRRKTTSDRQTVQGMMQGGVS